MAELLPTNPDRPDDTLGSTALKPESATTQPGAQQLPPDDIDPDERSLTSIVGEALGEAGAWAAANPLGALLLAAIAATLVYFYQYVHPFYSGSRSTLVWARSAWNPEGDQSYGAFVPLISLGLFVYHWGELRRAPKQGDNSGLGWIAAGILLFVLAVRCLQPRMALLSIPFLLYGILLFVWGSAVGRIALFPCAFLVFMIPVGALTQATFKLQFLVTGSVAFLSHLIGVGVQAVGTTLRASDHSFDFEIAEGCSGIRSLMAMVMITAAYVHLTQDRLWKKLTIFGASVVFAIIGNVGRVFSIILVARFWDKKVAGGAYHDTSGWIFFPIAMAAMLLFDWLVNLDYAKTMKAFKEVAQAANADDAWSPADTEPVSESPATEHSAGDAPLESAPQTASAPAAGNEPAQAVACAAPSQIDDGSPSPSQPETPAQSNIRRYDY